jgi:hypothetical protein
MKYKTAMKTSQIIENSEIPTFTLTVLVMTEFPTIGAMAVAFETSTPYLLMNH